MAAARLAPACLALVGLAACATPTAPPPDPGPGQPPPLPVEVYEVLEAAEHYYSRGDLQQALDTLGTMPPDSEGLAYANDLAELARDELDALCSYWEARAEPELAKGRLNQALVFMRQARAYAPHQEDARQSQLDERIAAIEQQLAERSEALKAEVERARGLLASGDSSGAFNAFVKTGALQQQLALRHGDLDFVSLRYLASYRMKREELAPTEAAARPWRAKKAAPPSRGASRGAQEQIKAAARAALASDEAAEAAEGPDATEAARRAAADAAERARAKERGRTDKRVADQLKAAAAAESARDFFNAILGYREALALDAANAAATEALRRLEPRKLELIAEYHESASRYFIKQQLEQAVPFFRKILALDPADTKARQGLQMYENLQRIRKESGG